MDYQAVVAVKVTTDRDQYGDETTTQTEQTVDRVLFEPQQATERTDSRSPGVVTPAKFYGVFPKLDADDFVRDSGGVLWQVIGGSIHWGNLAEVPVKRASGV